MRDLLDISSKDSKELEEENTKLRARVNELELQLDNKPTREYEFSKDETNWTVRVVISEYKGATPKFETHIIPKENVKVAWKLIQGLNKDKTNKAEVGELLIEYYDLPYKDHKELSGNRKEYFELFYYPVTILAHLGYVSYKRTIHILKREKK